MNGVGYCPAIILARGGSKRVPGKNTKMFCGKPLIVWTIEAAKAGKYIDEVYVSTDDKLIAEVSKQCRAKVIWRDWISQDDEMGCVPGLKAIDVLEKQGKTIEVLYSMLPTSPIRLPGQLERGMEIWISQSKQGTLSWSHSPKEMTLERRIYEYGGIGLFCDKSSSFWTARIGDGILTAETYKSCFNGMMELMKTEPGTHSLGNTINWHCPIEIWQTYEVDTPEQWEVAEYWFKKKIIDVYGENPYGKK